MDDDRAPTEPLRLKLRALQDGAYTRLDLCGALDRIPTGPELRRLLAQLARLQGGPLDVVLCIADAPMWLQIWNGTLATVSERHGRVRLLINRSTLAGGDGDDG
jgi:hypothetical protein